MWTGNEIEEFMKCVGFRRLRCDGQVGKVGCVMTSCRSGAVTAAELAGPGATKFSTWPGTLCSRQPTGTRILSDSMQRRRESSTDKVDMTFLTCTAIAAAQRLALSCGNCFNKLLIGSIRKCRVHKCSPTCKWDGRRGLAHIGLTHSQD